ncbi:MAG TPA: hypothetical protein VGM88_35375 [Kofleriaceae bacterium]
MLVAALVGCGGNSRTITPAKSTDSQAQQLRDFFEREGRIHNSSTVHALVASLFLPQTPKACGLERAVDAPARVEPHVASIYAVDVIDSDRLCATAPTPTLCSAIRGSCLAVDTAIFCDVRFEAQMNLLAERAYYDVFTWLYAFERSHEESPEERAMRQRLPIGSLYTIPYPPILQPKSFLGTASYARDLYDPGVDSSRNKILLETQYVSKCHGSLFAELPLQLGVYGPVVSHEYAHVEQHACPGAIPPPPEADAKIERYRGLACSTARSDELLADMRSVQLLDAAVGEGLFDISQIRQPESTCAPDGVFVPAIEERAKWNLRGEYYSVYVIGLLVGGEYRGIMGPDRDRGEAAIHGEPPFELHAAEFQKATTAFYRSFGYEASRRAPSSVGLLGHMSEPYRIALLLESDPQVLIARTFPRERAKEMGFSFLPGSRLPGLLWGHLVALHERGCRATRASGEALATTIVDQTFPDVSER